MASYNKKYIEGMTLGDLKDEIRRLEEEQYANDLTHIKMEWPWVNILRTLTKIQYNTQTDTITFKGGSL